MLLESGVVDSHDRFTILSLCALYHSLKKYFVSLLEKLGVKEGMG